MSYDDAYSSALTYFGSNPTTILVDYAQYLNKDHPVLDVGAGQGRNSIFLARNGYTIEAIDPSGVAVNSLTSMAESEHFPLKAIQCSFEDYQPKTQHYSGILIFGILQLLSRKMTSLLINKIESWTTTGSLIFVTAFTTDDPSFHKIEKKNQVIGKNSFQSTSGEIMTFLEPGEITTLFPAYEVVHFREYMGSLHRHGQGEEHYHGVVEAVLRRT